MRKTLGRTGLFFLLGAVVNILSAKETLILHESFETEGQDDRYILIGGHDDGDDNYVARRHADALEVDLASLDGEWVMGFQDVNFADIPDRTHGDLYEEEGLTDREARLKFEDIDISGMGELRISMSVASFWPGNEPNDDLFIEVRFDEGTWMEVGGFKSGSANSQPVYYMGRQAFQPHYQAPDQLSAEFTTWSWPVIGHGSHMDMRITVAGNAGNETFHIDKMGLHGDPDLEFVTAAFAESQLTEPESGGIVNALTLTLGAPAPEGGITFDLEPADGFSTASLSLPSPSVTIPSGERTLQVPAEIVQDDRYMGTKIVDLLVRTDGFNPARARVFVENSTPKPNVYITEVLLVVPGLQEEDVFGDANGDGIYHNAQDKFVEIMNLDDHAIDLGNWVIQDPLIMRHEFPAGTTLNPGQAAVAFGGGTPEGGFGGALVTTMSGGPLFLGFSIAYRWDFIVLQAPFESEVDRFVELPMRDDFITFSMSFPDGHYGKERAASVHRLNREPSEPTLEIVLPDHMHSAIDGAEERLFSPGTWYDGTVSTGKRKGWTRLPTVFSEIAYNHGDGWFWDPAFGWLYSGAPQWDLPWVYMAQLNSFCYVMKSGGLWLYIPDRASWYYTDYGLFPWAYQYSDSQWIIIENSPPS